VLHSVVNVALVTIRGHKGGSTLWQGGVWQLRAQTLASPPNILVIAAVRSVKTYIRRKALLTSVTNLRFSIGVSMR